MKSSNSQELIHALEKSAKETLSYFDLPEQQLQKSYGEGKWTVRQILHHLTDAETILYDRVRRTISVPDQVIWAFDQEAWAVELNYQQFPMEINKSIFQATRTSIIYLVGEFYESRGANTFVHSQTGKRTLQEEFDKIAWHNEGHLKQIRLALS